ncbi:hypothetical protein C8J57DRAFT_1356750, partial [Mycena rebaudengoi]
MRSPCWSPLVLSLIHPGSPLLPQVAQLIKFLTALCIPLPRVPISCTLAGDECYPSVYVAGLVYSSTSMSFGNSSALSSSSAQETRTS